MNRPSHPSRPLPFLARLATAGLLAITTSASAGVITFDGLTGETADPFTTHTEGGYIVTATLGEWKKGLIFGDPLPSIYVSELGPDTPFGSLSVTAQDGSAFYFRSLDLQAFNTAVGFEIRGTLDGAQIFSLPGSQLASPEFQTLPGAGGLLVIDTLTFDISGGVGSFSVDNIDVTAVPEPATHILALASLGLCGLMLRRRR